MTNKLLETGVPVNTQCPDVLLTQLITSIPKSDKLFEKLHAESISCLVLIEFLTWTDVICP